MAFKNLMYPPEILIEYQTSETERFKTTIASPGGSAAESRIAEWGKFGRRIFNPQASLISEEALARLRAFFNLVQGQAYTFRLEWPTDRYAVDVPQDTAAGGLTIHLQRRHVYEVYEWDENQAITYETVYLPVALVVPSTVQLTVNGNAVLVNQNENTLWLFNDSVWNAGPKYSANVDEYGNVTFNTALDPGADVTASFTYHFKVRFSTDDLQVQAVNFETYSVVAPMIEATVNEENAA